ncbi:DUF2887 domain-containing protein [Methylolobus aquaticus]
MQRIRESIAQRHPGYLGDLLGAEHLGCNARLARLVILGPAATPAEARALATERNITADPLETRDLIETTLVSECPHGSRKEIRDMLQLPITDEKKPRVLPGGLRRGARRS